MMIEKLVWLALAGAVGTLARYGLGLAVQNLVGEEFPWGTVVVNILGCFLFGVVWSLATERMAINAQTRVVLLTGFMGAFTTFSTYIFETGQLLRDAQWWVAAGNLVLQILAGLVALFLGLALGRLP